MTVAEALNVADRSVSYREAEVLLAHVLATDRAWLLAHPEKPLTPDQAAQYADALHRREQNEPVAYITGTKEFYGYPFRCDRRALIPRPETEGAIDQAILFLTEGNSRAGNRPTPPWRILELGTGCGNIVVTLGLELGKRNIDYQLWATDVDSAALALAQENLSELAIDQPRLQKKVRFLEADLFNHPALREAAPFDLIVANLPYVPEQWRQDPQAPAEVVFQEPDVALFGGPDGLAVYRRFFATAPQFLHESGAIVAECSEDQGEATRSLAQAAFPRHDVAVRRDYADLDRILTVLPPA
jgi:release factor glutamine methyltransferase